MNEVLIENWNSYVPKDAFVIIVGDVAMGGKSKAGEVKDILYSLNGSKGLVKGNHDNYVLDEPVRGCFEWVVDYLECKVVRHNQKSIRFVISHYPFLTWNGAGKPNVYHLHGHSHSSINHLNKGTTRLDVGIDNNNLAPFSVDEVLKRFEKALYTPVDHHSSRTSYH